MQQTLPLPSTLSFVDIETSGATNGQDRIIEIGILRVENGKLIDSFQSLINPLQPVSPFIQTLTGIKSKDLQHAPTFYDLRDTIADYLDNAVFVAHNVRFDYRFIKSEFQNIGETFSSPQLCTIRLFRSLVPGRRRYNLDELISFFNIKCSKRHRAYDDAKVLWDFYRQVQQSVDAETFQHAVNLAQKSHILPTHIDKHIIESLPETPGVYTFWGDGNVPLYIGKSKDIKHRILSHFSSDGTNSTDAKMHNSIKRISTQQTSGEMSALLLESHLIKTLQPLHNKLLRKKHELIIAKPHYSEDMYLHVNANEAHSIPIEEIDASYGIFKSQKQYHNKVSEIARTHDLCPKLLGIEHGPGPCFSYHLKTCLGACVGKERPASYNVRVVSAFGKYKIKQWPFDGPVYIRESSNSHHDGFMIDKWCVLSSGTWDDMQSKDIHHFPYVFDFDVYKILKRFILGKSNIHITPMQQADASEAQIN